MCKFLQSFFFLFLVALEVGLAGDSIQDWKPGRLEHEQFCSLVEALDFVL